MGHKRGKGPTETETERPGRVKSGRVDFLWLPGNGSQGSGRGGCVAGYGKRHAAVAPRTSNDEGWIPDSREGSCGIVPSFALPAGDSPFGMCTSAQRPQTNEGKASEFCF